MSRQPMLPSAPHVNDLPPKWDGHRVEWGRWETPPPTALERFHGGQTTCPRCGSHTPQQINRGVVWAKPVGLLHFPVRRRWDSRAARSGGDHAVLHLTAYRCPDCRVDEIDGHHNPMWVLDDNDYDDEGSYA